MKQWKWGFGLGVILLAVCVWADEFKFVSILSGPVASFGQLETKACAVTQPGKFNAGSAASTEGTINIQGAPLQVGSLLMDHQTTISTNTENLPSDQPFISWLVDTLQVGSSGSVTVDKVIANIVTLDNGDTKGATLKVQTGQKEGDLIINGGNDGNDGTWTENGTAKESLYVDINGNGSQDKFDFSFSTNGEPEGEATWKWIQVGCSENTEDVSDKEYLITTAPASNS